MTKKDEEIYKYSSPEQAKKMLKKYYGNIELYTSSRKNKKYMVLDPNGQWVHFGQMGYEDYTKHKDKIRRKNFQSRNFKWQFEPPYTPSHLSWYILW